ncbi:glutathione S-transferase family protein [Polyangium aurulentum]|uniref:glutathione S-transferase family protein n=1 Tax=Polyangium aurulentum TaxID=2567896 RepID=UPI0010AE819E|nr:glutathione S-transferase family protein [Polyangium aurulentum]UQA55317.1 glutathione S-transferase family protein [Polyangium aurulentum]
MTTDRKVTLYHSPQSRSTGIAILLEELGAPHDLHILDMKKGEQREPAYLAINPLGKVPAVKHGDAIITEQVAIVIYLADLFPEAGITPAIGDPLRGPYLRWLVYYAASFEPAVVDRAMKREVAPQGVSPYGDFDTMLKVITDQLAKGPYLLGERFTAADVLWGTALGWTTSFKLVPEHPVIMDYVKRLAARPAPIRVHERDTALAAARDAAAGTAG